MHRLLLSLLLLVVSAPLACSTKDRAPDIADKLEKASVGSHRSAEHIARNAYRHPVETLTFFGLEEDMTVLEILPGGLWYAEVIAPALLGSGRYLAAGIDPTKPDLPEYQVKGQERMVARFESEADVFGDVQIVALSTSDGSDLGEPESVDMILTFRNMHGWVRSGVAEAVVASFFGTLKPGGVLGIVQHRAGPTTNPDPEAFVGYVPEQRVIAIAEGAGFVLEAQSEINANPADSADYPKGVWTLPPSLTLGDEDRDVYLAIGESDRMTLRFVKPR
jgi:predicted methyltransferase